MPIFVEHKETGDLFVLVGGGFGATHAGIITDLGVNTQMKSTHTLVCLCDRDGNMGWLDSSKLRVIHVDGTDIKDLHDLGKFDEDTI